MALGHRLRPFRTPAAPAAANGRRPVRAAAVVRGAGEPQEQPGHQDSLFGRQGAGHVLRAEPLLRPVRRTLPARLRPVAPARRIRRAPIIAALISTEDVRYRGHSGIDLMSLVRVGVKTVLMQNTSQGGGSTITQQLAKNLFPRDINENRGKIARTTKLVVSNSRSGSRP